MLAFSPAATPEELQDPEIKILDPEPLILTLKSYISTSFDPIAFKLTDQVHNDAINRFGKNSYHSGSRSGEILEKLSHQISPQIMPLEDFYWVLVQENGSKKLLSIGVFFVQLIFKEL